LYHMKNPSSFKYLHGKLLEFFQAWSRSQLDWLFRGERGGI